MLECAHERKMQSQGLPREVERQAVKKPSSAQWFRRRWSAKYMEAVSVLRQDITEGRAEMNQQKCMLPLDGDVGDLFSFEEHRTTEVSSCASEVPLSAFRGLSEACKEGRLGDEQMPRGIGRDKKHAEAFISCGQHRLLEGRTCANTLLKASCGGSPTTEKRRIETSSVPGGGAPVGSQLETYK